MNYYFKSYYLIFILINYDIKFLYKYIKLLEKYLIIRYYF